MISGLAFGSAAGPGRDLLVLHLGIAPGDGHRPATLLSVTALPVNAAGVLGRPRRWVVRPERPVSAAVVQRLRIQPIEQTSARPWEAIAGDVAATLATRVVVVYGWSEFLLMQGHLPSWSPSRVLAVRRFARRIQRHTDLDDWWRTATCPDAARAALLFELFSRLVAGGHRWVEACSSAALPLGRYQSQPRANSPAAEGSGT